MDKIIYMTAKMNDYIHKYNDNINCTYTDNTEVYVFYFSMDNKNLSLMLLTSGIMIRHHNNTEKYPVYYFDYNNGVYTNRDTNNNQLVTDLLKFVNTINIYDFFEYMDTI